MAILSPRSLDQHGHVVINLDVHATVSASSSSSTASPYNNLAFIVPALITFVQIKFPEASDKCFSGFESHHATTMAAIASFACVLVGTRGHADIPYLRS